MPYRLSVGAGLFTNLFWLVIKTHESEWRERIEITTLTHKLTLTILSPFHDTEHNDVAGDATGKAISVTGKADVASTTGHPHTCRG